MPNHSVNQYTVLVYGIDGLDLIIQISYFNYMRRHHLIYENIHRNFKVLRIL